MTNPDVIHTILWYMVVVSVVLNCFGITAWHDQRKMKKQLVKLSDEFYEKKTFEVEGFQATT